MEPLVVELPGAPSPVGALAALRDLPYPLLLESAAPGGEAGRYSFLAADPFMVLTLRGGALYLATPQGVERLPGDPFLALQRLLDEHRSATIPGIPPFQGGAAGYFGYDLGGCIERIPAHRTDDLGLPDLCVGFYDWVLGWDHASGRAYLVSTGMGAPPAERARRAAGRAATAGAWLRGDRDERGWNLPGWSGAGEPTADTHPVPGLPGVRSTFSRAAYLSTAARVREYILAGDIFQANLSQRLEAPYAGEPFELYRSLRERSPAPYAGYLDVGGAALVCSSPELFLRLRHREVETRPIKGTAPRADEEAEDARRARALAASEKDRSENVMIVDLLRNDLSRVCTDESVLVPRLCEVESHGSVHHLVSTVTGRLREGLHACDLLRAAFPGGSITGAPKIRAMEIIAELEPTRRGPYTGALGYIGFDGTMETNIVIRTFVVKDGTAHFQVGGGIVADSVPEREYQETLDKAAGMLAALEERAWS